GLPGAGQADVALLRLEALPGGAVDGQGPASLAPAGDAQVEVEGPRGPGLAVLAQRLDGDLDLSLPGVARLLHQLDGSAFEVDGGRAAHVEDCPDPVGLVGVGPLAHAGEVADDVGRAAGAVEPGDAELLAGAGQGVGIEEAVAAQRDAREQAVVDL